MDPFLLKNLGYWENKDLAVAEDLSLKFACNSGSKWESKISVYDNEVQRKKLNILQLPTEILGNFIHTF